MVLGHFKIHAYKLFIAKTRWLTEVFNISLKKCENLRKYVSWKVEIWHIYQQQSYQQLSGRSALDHDFMIKIKSVFKHFLLKK